MHIWQMSIRTDGISCVPAQELEQGKHELRLKLEGCQSQWESQASDLEKDARELSAQVERLTGALAEAERDKSRAQRERDEQTQRLREQLDTVSPTGGGDGGGEFMCPGGGSGGTRTSVTPELWRRESVQPLGCLFMEGQGPKAGEQFEFSSPSLKP